MAREVLAERERRERGALRQPVAQAEARARRRKRGADLVLQLHAGRRPARADVGDARQVVLRDVGVVHDAVRHRAHRPPRRDLLALDQAQRVLGIEAPRAPHGLRAAREHHDCAGVEAGDVEERRGDQRAGRARRTRRHAAVGGGREHHPRAVEELHADQREDVALRVDRALRPAGGAARVQDRGRVVLLDRDFGQRRVAIRAPILELALDLDHGHAERTVRDALEPAAIRDQDLRVAVAHAVADLVAGPPAVQADRDGAERLRRPERDDPLGAVRGEDRDAIAAPHAEARFQRARDARD